MGNSLREVKMRISSTQSTAQITKAMYMVSSSKGKKAEKTYRGYQDFMERIERLIGLILSKAKEEDPHPLLRDRPIKTVAYLLITSDRGLAGSYNSSVYKTVEEQVKNDVKEGKKAIFGAIGKQGYAYLKRKGYPLIFDSPTLVRDDVMLVDILPLAKCLIDAYLEEKVDAVVLIFNHFINRLQQSVELKTLLPVLPKTSEKDSIDYIFETGLEKTLQTVLPMYVEDLLYGMILDAKVCEHAARMNAMQSATDNAEAIIEKLQLLYNRARQAGITAELVDIIGGAGAIGGNNG